MFRKSLLLVCLVVAGLPLAAQAATNAVLFVLVDPQTNRAYIPEGTVLPAGFQVRAERATVERPLFIDKRDWRGARVPRLAKPSPKRLTGPAMVFEYAPAERFEQARRQYEAKYGVGSSRIKANDDQYCQSFYVTQQNTGIYGTYTNGLTGTFCGWTNTIVGNSYLWEFTAIGDYSDDDIYVNPAVGIYDDNNNYNCYDEYYYSGDTGSCTASATTQKTGTFCTNNVHVWGLLYIIEWMPQDPYHDNYLGFNLQLSFCTGFY